MEMRSSIVTIKKSRDVRDFFFAYVHDPPETAKLFELRDRICFDY